MMSIDSSRLRTSPTLLRQLGRGDATEAWNRFATLYTPPILEWCRRQGLQDADAADVAQDVLCKVMRAMDRFRYEPRRGGFRPWLKTVTSNAVRDLRRKWRRAANNVGGAEELEDVALRPVIDSLTGALEEECQRTLLARAHEEIRCRVQPRTWLIYERTALLGEKPDAVATDLGVPISSVYLAKSKTLARVRRQIRTWTER